MSKVLVIDLDGTLMSVNTFHYYIKFICYSYLKLLKLKSLFLILGVVVLRVFKIVSHSVMKFEILKIVETTDSLDHESFVVNLLKFLNPILEIKQGDFDLKILATAAPENYSKIIAEKLDFDYCIATNSKDKLENIRENKLHNVKCLLKKINKTHVDLFISDHIDDLPLFNYSKSIILVNPDINLLEKLSSNENVLKVYNF